MISNRLIFDYNLTQFIYSNYNIISTILLNGSSDTIDIKYNYISRVDGDTISYLTLSKMDTLSNISFDSQSLLSQEKNRTKIKIGRFITKILKKETCERFSITNKVIEDFVNLYKSYFNCDEKNLHVVSGNDIKKWYLEDNYLSINPNSTLWKSCMRQEYRNRFLELYTKNSQIKMLIFLDENNKLRSRAILWDNVLDTNGNSYKLMDRIYSLYDHDVNFFKKWAIENGYTLKSEQNSKSELSFQINGDDRKTLEMCVKLDNFKLNYYPYLDTFKYFNYDTGYLYNYEKEYGLYKLNRTDGILDSDLEYNEDENNEDAYYYD